MGVASGERRGGVSEVVVVSIGRGMGRSEANRARLSVVW